MTMGRQSPPPNLATRALEDERFRPKVSQSRRAYSRKIKYSKGRTDPDVRLFLAPPVEPDRACGNRTSPRQIVSFGPVDAQAGPVHPRERHRQR